MEVGKLDANEIKRLCSEAKEPFAVRVFVSAEIARTWMRLNLDENRPIVQSRINEYGRDMKRHWKENGETIKFSKDGFLIDGQHRLQACMECGVGFWSLVVFGIEKEAFLTIDRGQSRSAGQVLHLSTGINDYNAVAATISYLYRFRDGIMLTSGRPTASEADEILRDNPSLPDSVKAARGILHRFRAGSVPIVAVCHYLFTRQDATLAEVFFDSLASGASLREVDPVFQLRARIISASASTSKRISSHELLALFFKAWLAEREQRTMGILRWVAAESFPNIGPIENVNKVRPEKVTTQAGAGRQKRRGRPPKVEPTLPSPIPSPPPSKLDQLIQKHHGLDRRS